MPTVSVIMNCLNCSKYLREAMDSVYAQTYKDWEIIFWDNASTDNSAEISKDYDEKVNYFRGKETVSIGKARNLAIEQARGEYIAFLDCDDMWMPEKLELQLHALEKENTNFCYSKVRWITYSKEGQEIGSRVLGKRLPCEGHRLIMELCKGNIITWSSLMAKAELCKEIKFNEKLRRLEDYDHILRASPKMRLSYIDQELATYRMYPTNFTSLLHDIASEELRIIDESFVKLHLNKEQKMKFRNHIILAEAHEKAGASFSKYLKCILSVFINDPFVALKSALRWLKQKKWTERRR